MFWPGKESYTEITPTEFEKYVISMLEAKYLNNGVENASFTHNLTRDAHDGSYQIDGEIRFSIMGVDYITLVECKHYKGPIKREQIQILHDKIESVGAHKGIFVTTSFFQSGALLYAKEHGIALITIADGSIQYEARGRNWIDKPVIPPWVERKPYIMVWQEQTSDTSYTCSYTSTPSDFYSHLAKSIGGNEP